MSYLDKVYELKERINRCYEVYQDVPAYLIEEYTELFGLLSEEEQNTILAEKTYERRTQDTTR